MGAAVGWGALAASSLIMTVLGFAVAAGLSHVA